MVEHSLGKGEVTSSNLVKGFPSCHRRQGTLLLLQGLYRNCQRLGRQHIHSNLDEAGEQNQQQSHHDKGPKASNDDGEHH